MVIAGALAACAREAPVPIGDHPLTMPPPLPSAALTIASAETRDAGPPGADGILERLDQRATEAEIGCGASRDAGIE